MVKQYSLSPEGFSSEIPFVKTSVLVTYDEVVDKSQFRPDSEQVRMFHLTGSGSNINPVYDDPDNMPTDLEVRIRSGKLDKAEITQLQYSKEEQLKKSASDLKKEKLQSDKEKIAEARQDFLDKSTGFKGSNQLETE